MTLTQAIDWLKKLSAIDGKTLNYDKWQEVVVKTNEALYIVSEFSLEAKFQLSSIERDTGY